MIFRFIFLSAMLLFSPFGKVVLAQPNSKLEQKIIRSIYKSSGIDKDKVPNLLILYSKDGLEGQIELDFRPDDSITLDPNRLVALGDVSQFISAQAILQLVKQGQLHLSDDVNQFLPQGYQNSSTVSIESLLTHHSGLPKIPNNFGQYELDKNDPYRYYSDTALLEFYRDYGLAHIQGNYRYSLVNYAILQYILEQKGHPFPQSNELSNIGFKEGEAIQPIDYHYFTGAQGLKMTPNQLFDFIKETRDKGMPYPLYPTLVQKNVFASYGYHVVKSKKKQEIILKGAVNGFTIMAIFDSLSDRTLVLVANAQDGVGHPYYALSWFFD